MAKAKQNWGAFVLELLGSLVFIGVVFSPSAISYGSGTPFANGGAFWVPLFVGAAVIAAVALFLASFAQITSMNGPKISLMGLETAAVAGLALIALTWTNSQMVWASILGFVLCFIGSAMGAMK